MKGSTLGFVGLILFTLVIHMSCVNNDTQAGVENKIENDSVLKENSSGGFSGSSHKKHISDKDTIPFDTLVYRLESADRAQWQKPDKLIQKLGLKENMVVVDIGAGTGYFTFRIAEFVNKVIAIEVDKRFVDYLNKATKRNKTSNVEVRYADFDNPTLTNQEADLVIIVNTYHHIDNRVRYFRMVRQGMKHGSKLVVVDFKSGNFTVGPSNEEKVPLAAAIRELKQAGFQTIVTDTTFLPYQYIIEAKY
jgi:SAM-dependent methyltransferase